MGSNPYPAAEPPKKGGGKTWIILLVLGCVAVPVLVAIIGIIAAIAIPSLLRARVSANEAQNIGDIRTLISAEISYQSQTARFGSAECLATPSSCIKGYSGSAFLSAEATQTQKGGYRRTLTVSPDGESFTYVVVPLQPGSTGTRAFCGDSSGIICATSGSQPTTSGGRCEVDRSCAPI